MKKRRSFFKKLVLTTAGLGLFSSIVRAGKSDKMIKGNFVHMVFFWLKPEVDAVAFIDQSKAFVCQVPEVVSYHIGRPAGTPREVVDNSYSVSLVVTFDSKEDQDAYQKHPVHLKYVDDNKDKWLDVKIYDSWKT